MKIVQKIVNVFKNDDLRLFFVLMLTIGMACMGAIGFLAVCVWRHDWVNFTFIFVVFVLWPFLELRYQWHKCKKGGEECKTE